MTCLLEDL
ncbi:unnamed protein product [Larinioides sclopetarius]|uniref:Uncharacterized protein n=1 Tax=Larinioides sclopetarius TaxID=280406 RepID=A0AAV1Z1L3_9ARAC